MRYHALKLKSSWKPPNERPALKISLNKAKRYLFDICQKQQKFSKFNSEDWNKKDERDLAW